MEHRMLPTLRRAGLVAAAALALAFACALAPASAYAYDHNEKGAIGTVSCPNGNSPRSYYVHSPKDAMNALDDMTSTRNNPCRETKVQIDLSCDWNTKGDGRITVPNGCEVTINLHGHMINRDKALSYKDQWYAEGSGEVIYVDGGTLYLHGSSTMEEAATQHKGHYLDNGKFWDYDGSGKDIMTGGLITGGACDDWHGAGGISLARDNSRAYIYDTTVAGNLTDQVDKSRYGHGAGIAAHGSHNVVELHNTAVVFNHAEGYGGGIYMRNSDSTLSISRGSQVSYNLGVCDGGGIYLDAAIDLTIEGSKVDGNLTHGYGGGIYSNGASNVKLLKDSSGNAAEVNSNQAWGDGGGIYLNGSKTTLVSDGSHIDSNRGMQTYEEVTGDKYNRKNGAGLYIDGSNSNVTLKNGSSVNNNEAHRGRGGGIFVDGDDVKLSIEGSSVSGNHADFSTTFVSSGGGGIYHNGKNGEVVLKNSSVDGNFAGREGGGIYDAYDGTKFTLDNSKVTGNSTWMSGGGVYLNDTATLELKNGSKIANNTSGGGVLAQANMPGALGHGAGVFNDDSGTKIILDGGSSISDNEAQDSQDRSRLSACGGGVYSTDDISIVSHDGTGSIANNKSYDQGAGIFIDGELTLDGIAVTGNHANGRYTGGGVWCASESYKALTLANRVVIDGNTGNDSGVPSSNLCIRGKQEVCSAGGSSALSADSKIGITVDEYKGSGDRRVTGNQAALSKIGDAYKAVFYADNNEYSVKSDGNYVYISGERSDRYRLNVKFTHRDKSLDYTKGSTITLKSSDYLTGEDSDSGSWGWRSGNTWQIEEHRYASKRNRIDYWTITDASGSKQKLVVKDGVATFTMPDSDTTAEAHIIRPASGIGIKVNETTSFNDLATPSTTSATATFVDIRDRFYTLFPQCESNWIFAHEYWQDYTDEWGRDDGGEWIRFGESSLVDRDNRWSFDHISEGEKANNSVKIERLGATDVVNDKGVLTGRKVNYRVTISKALLDENDFFAADNTALSQVQVLFNDGKTSEAFFSNKSGTGGGSYVSEDVCKASAADDGSQVLTFSVVYDNKVTVTLDADGGTMPSDSTATRNVTAGSELGNLPTPTRVGHKFVGWYVEGTDTAVDSKTTVDANTTLVAKWELLDTARILHLVVYHNEADTTDDFDTVYEGDCIPKPRDPYRQGYTFAGWYSDEALTKAYDFSVATGAGGADIDLYAKWAPDAVTVSFDSAGGSSIENIQASYDGTFTKPADPVREGYAFLKWIGPDGNPYNFSAKLAGDVTLTATWGRSVSFAGEGIEATSSVVSDGSVVSKPADPTRAGYHFEGWFSDEALTQSYDFNQPVTANVVLYAKWEPAVTLSFDTLGGEQVSSITVAPGATVALSDLPKATRDNYKFAGWNDADGKEVTEDLVVTADATLTARWRGRTIHVWEHNIDSEAPFKLMSYGDKLQKSDLDQTVDQADPVREGHTFAGWYADEALSTPLQFGQTLTGDLDVYAKWIAGKVALTFDSTGGSEVASQELDYGTTALEPTAPTREGYVFQGWFSDEALTQSFDFSAPVTATATLHAKWAEAVTLSFDAGEGSASVESITVAKGVAVGSLPSAMLYTDDGELASVLAGWASDGVKVTTSTTFDEDTILTARWVDVDTAVYATFVVDGEAVGGEVVEAGAAFDEPELDKKDGYTLDGWYLDEGCTDPYDFAAPASASIALYAKWLDPSARDLSKAKVTLAKAKLAYSGKRQAAAVKSVELGGKKLKAGADYKVKAAKGKKVGTYKVTVTGLGDYQGAASVSYKIVPAKVKGVAAKAAGKGKAKLTWSKRKAQTGGFQVRYAYSKAGLAKGKAVKLIGASKAAAALKGLKGGKRCYFKVRAYKVVEGKTYYSAWSAVKAVKVK